jgi:LysM repeat protein
MTSRSLSTLTICAVSLSLAVAPVAYAADASNAAPATPAEPAPAPAPAPAATPAPADTTTTAPAAPEERPTSYTMVAGDTLDSIAKKFNTSIQALAKLNKIPKSDYRKLRAGKVLQIPPAKPDTTSSAK